MALYRKLFSKTFRPIASQAPIFFTLNNNYKSCRSTFSTIFRCSSYVDDKSRSSFRNVAESFIYGKSRQCCSTSAVDKVCEDDQKKISVTFVDKYGEENEIKVPIGMSMLEAAHENDIELEGACEGSLACSTCHVIVMDVDYYNKLEDPGDEENDMLDLAFGLTETSRLGCQVIASPELDGIRLALPAATRNFAVDGYVPKPH
ncbi:hypothetical protein GIB67_027106 [Kingdonia uniflora]|uniref:2Fe-2S ferredoxin-type domain-containing protein n=1 Tax=Kingdonia uniflora TaxID=39325 RepID=A0A7J7P1V7_9MAGN|nr:hypothetical protein GIB67_027106 [Kingdonia uniflora]